MIINKIAIWWYTCNIYYICECVQRSKQVSKSYRIYENMLDSYKLKTKKQHFQKATMNQAVPLSIPWTPPPVRLSVRESSSSKAQRTCAVWPEWVNLMVWLQPQTKSMSLEFTWCHFLKDSLTYLIKPPFVHCNSPCDLVTSDCNHHCEAICSNFCFWWWQWQVMMKHSWPWRKMIPFGSLKMFRYLMQKQWFENSQWSPWRKQLQQKSFNLDHPRFHNPNPNSPSNKAQWVRFPHEWHQHVGHSIW